MKMDSYEIEYSIRTNQNEKCNISQRVGGADYPLTAKIELPKKISGYIQKEMAEQRKLLKANKKIKSIENIIKYEIQKNN